MKISLQKLYILTIGAYLALACKPQQKFRSEQQPVEMLQPQSSPQIEKNEIVFDIVKLEEQVSVDVVFLFDTTASMYEEKKSLEANFVDFLEKINAQDIQGSKVQIFLIGENFNFPDVSHYKNFTVMNQFVGSHDALKVAMSLFDGSLNKKFSNELFLRLQSSKELVFISDDNAYIDDLDPFIKYVNSSSLLQDKLGVHAIIGLASSQATETCKIDNIGDTYIKLINDKSIHAGLIHDLCKYDLSAHLGHLSNALKSKISVQRTYKIPSQFFDRSPAEIKVDNHQLLKHQYICDTKSLTVELAESLNLLQAKKLTISFNEE